MLNELVDLLTGQSLVLGGEDVLYVLALDGLLLHGHDLLHEVDVDALERRQVETGVYGQQTGQMEVLDDVGSHLLVDLPLAVVLSSEGSEVHAGGLVDLDGFFSVHVSSRGSTKQIKNKTNNDSGFSLIEESADSV